MPLVTTPGRFNSGTFTDNESGAHCIDIIIQELLAFTDANSLTAWEVYDTITNSGSARDIVVLSRGNPITQNRRIYCRLVRTATSAFRTDPYADWSTSSHTGRNTISTTHTLGAGDSVEWWAQVNEYAAFFIFRTTTDSGTINVSFGHVNRSHVPTMHQGTCFSTGALTSGSNVAIPVDHDISASIVVGQGIDVIPMAPDGGALPTFNPERCTVSAVGPTTITVATLAANKTAYCAIGDDPLSTFALVSPPTALNFSLERAVGSAGTQVTTIAALNGNLAEAGIDPDFGSLWQGCAVVTDDTADGHRGVLYHVGLWGTDGTQTNARFWRHDHDDEQAWFQSASTGAALITSRLLSMRVGSTPDTFEDVPAIIGHGTFEHTSGTIAAGGTTKMQQFFNIVHAALLAHSSGAWSVWDALGAGGGFLDRNVYRSTGARNDTRIDIEMLCTAANLSFDAAVSWSNVGHNGQNTIGSAQYSGSNTNQVDYWLTVSEYGLAMLFVQGANTRMFLAGQPYRGHIPPHQRGTAFMTAGVSAGSNVVIPVDRDLTGELQIGQFIDIVPVTVNSGTLPTFTVERVTVTAVSTTTVTVASLANAQIINTLIGDDPIPTGRSGFSATTPNPVLCLQRNGTGTASSSGTSPSSVDITEGANDPDLVGRFFGMHPIALPVSAAGAEFRGFWDLITMWTNPGVANGDTFQDIDTGRRFVTVNGLTLSSFAAAIECTAAGGTNRLGVLYDHAHARRHIHSGTTTASAVYDDGNFLTALPEITAPPGVAIEAYSVGEENAFAADKPLIVPHNVLRETITARWTADGTITGTDLTQASSPVRRAWDGRGTLPTNFLGTSATLYFVAQIAPSTVDTLLVLFRNTFGSSTITVQLASEGSFANPVTFASFTAQTGCRLVRSFNGPRYVNAEFVRIGFTLDSGSWNTPGPELTEFFLGRAYVFSIGWSEEAGDYQAEATDAVDAKSMDGNRVRYSHNYQRHLADQNQNFSTASIDATDDVASARAVTTLSNTHSRPVLYIPNPSTLIHRGLLGFMPIEGIDMQQRGFDSYDYDFGFDEQPPFYALEDCT